MIAKIRATFTHWVLGGLIYASAKKRILKDLCPPPPEIWELRITEPEPQYRAIGRIVQPDTFIVTDILNRDYLGDFGSNAWGNAMRDCDEQIQQLNITPAFFVGQKVADYVSKNCQDFPIKQQHSQPKKSGPNAGKASGRVRRSKGKGRRL